MKQTLIILLLSLFISQETSTLIGQELIDLNRFIEAYNFEKTDWSMTMKEKITSPDTLQNTIDQLSARYKQTKIEKNDTEIYDYEDIYDVDHMTISLKVVVHDNQSTGEIIAVITGSGEHSEMLPNDIKTLQAINKTYFTKRSHVYTCLSIEDNGIIKSDDFFNKVKEKFNLTHIQTQNDKIEVNTHKKVFYGYTPVWKEKLTIKDEPMNLQVVIDGSDSAKQKIIIGTPILINEY